MSSSSVPSAKRVTFLPGLAYVTPSRPSTGTVPPKSYLLAHWAICQTGSASPRPKRIVSVLVFSNPPFCCTISGHSGDTASPFSNFGSPRTSTPAGCFFPLRLSRPAASHFGLPPKQSVIPASVSIPTATAPFRILITSVFSDSDRSPAVSPDEFCKDSD